MIYVTGSSGLIGSYLCHKIPHRKISYRNNVDQVEFSSQEDSTLIHLASCSNTRYKLDSAEELLEKEVLTSLNLFRKFYKSNPNGRIIFLSSCGDLHWKNIDDGSLLDETMAPIPKTIHGSNKLLIENYGRILSEECNGKFISLRVSNVYGGKIKSNRINGLIDRYYYCLNNNQSMEIYCDSDSTYDWIHIEDVINCIIKSINYNHTDIFIVGSGESLSVKQVLNHLCKTQGSINITYKETTEPPTYVRVSCDKVNNLLGWRSRFKLIK